MKVRVHGKLLVPVYIDVEVDDDDKEKAYEAASDVWPGLSNYVGNGRRGGGLVGPCDPLEHNASIDAVDDTPEWDEVTPL